MKIIKEFKERWTAKTPQFWQEVQRVLLALSAMATVGLSQSQLMPTWAIEPLKIMAFCGVFGVFLAQLTKDTKDNASHNPTEPQNTTPANNEANNTNKKNLL